MSFNPNWLSQRDPLWKDKKLGTSSLTIGSSGCALSAVAMLLSGWGYTETPDTLNNKLKTRGGFMGAAIVWGAVSSIYPKVRYKNLIICRDSPAPLDEIRRSIEAGQPVLLELDFSPESGIQTHWVVAYAKAGTDFLVLDPYPYPTENDKPVLLSQRYAHGKLLKDAISAVVWYEASDATQTVSGALPSDGSLYVAVAANLASGLRLRSAASTNSETLSLLPASTLLKVLEPTEAAIKKIGVNEQWLNVLGPDGQQGYVAAWYVERAVGPPANMPSPNQPPVSAPAPASLIKAVNDLRTSRGLTAYQVSAPLSEIAQKHADYMAAAKSVSHFSADGKRPYQRALTAGYPLDGDISLGGFYSENILAGSWDVAGAVAEWLTDAPHTNTMLSESLQQIGAGIAVADGLIYYCIDAARPTNQPASTKPPVATPPATLIMIRDTLGDDVANVALEAPKKLSDSSGASLPRLVADIWNRYGGLLSALSSVLKIDVGTAVAVLAIESGGQAFGPDGRMIIRFENHIFYQYWGKNNQSTFAKYFTYSSGQTWLGHKWRPTSSEAWRPANQSDFHGVQNNEWEVFNFARTLDEAAAKMSISMGAPQIMGFNHSAIGFSTVHDMFEAFKNSERNQIVGFFDFVQGANPNSRNIQTLQIRDFNAFASFYNGSGAATRYGSLMSSAYDAFNELYKKQIKSEVAVVPPAPVIIKPPATPTPAPTPPVSTPPQPAPPPVEVEKGKVFVTVMSSVGASGLRMRKTASQLGALVAVQPVGSRLRALDAPDVALAKIGKTGSWLWVSDRNNLEGYVAAWLVELDKSSSTVTNSGGTIVTDSGNEPAKLLIHVARGIGSGGLRLRSGPSSANTTIKTLSAGAPLTVQEDAALAESKIGKFNEWIMVQDATGAQGYVAAWYTEK